MLSRAKSAGSVVLGVVLIALIGYAIFVAARSSWHALISVNASLAVALIAAAATVLASTVTVMLGRYYERKRDIEAHFRTEKIKIYDEFLREFFKVIYTADKADSNKHSESDGKSASDKLVEFLRRWQQQLIIWGGSDVLRAYFAWMSLLKAPNPNAQVIYAMDEFFRALRSDIGQHSRGLPRGIFANLILRHGELFMREAARNPSITLTELAALERERYGDQ